MTSPVDLCFMPCQLTQITIIIIIIIIINLIYIAQFDTNGILTALTQATELLHSDNSKMHMDNEPMLTGSEHKTTTEDTCSETGKTGSTKVPNIKPESAT